MPSALLLRHLPEVAEPSACDWSRYQRERRSVPLPPEIPKEGLGLFGSDAGTAQAIWMNLFPPAMVQEYLYQRRGFLYSFLYVVRVVRLDNIPDFNDRSPLTT